MMVTWKMVAICLLGIRAAKSPTETREAFLLIKVN